MSTFQWQEADCVMFYAALRQTEWSTDAVLPHFRNVVYIKRSRNATATLR
jgi:hypothetical protein